MHVIWERLTVGDICSRPTDGINTDGKLVCVMNSSCQIVRADAATVKS